MYLAQRAQLASLDDLPPGRLHRVDCGAPPAASVPAALARLGAADPAGPAA